MRNTYRYWFWLRTGFNISVLAWDRHKTIGIGTRHENIDSVLGKAKIIGHGLGMTKTYRYWHGTGTKI